MVKIADDRRKRIIDTFAARDLHKEQKTKTVNDFIKYGLQSGYGRSSDYGREKKEPEL